MRTTNDTHWYIWPTLGPSQINLERFSSYELKISRAGARHYLYIGLITNAVGSPRAIRGAHSLPVTVDVTS